jgi:hypothetical protein
MGMVEVVLFSLFIILAIIYMYFTYKLSRNVKPEYNNKMFSVLTFNVFMSDKYFNQTGIKYKRKMIFINLLAFIIIMIVLIK